MLTFNVFDRVFFVRSAEYGTAFTIDVNDKQYLVSARHVVDDHSNIHIFHEQVWKRCPCNLVGTGEGEIDVVVLAPNFQLSPAHELDPSGHFYLGQDAFFVGFPFRMWSEGGDVMQGRPLPFVKKGTVSAGPDPNDDVKRIYVDALNNEGFSGGPLLASDPNTTSYRAIGVVSKFRIEYEDVIDEEDKHTGLRVAYNPGFLVAYHILHVLDLIKKNPIGLDISGAA